MTTTKTALPNTEVRPRAELTYTEAKIQLDLERRLAELQAHLMKWMLIGALIVQAVVIVALVKLLP